jgi:N-acetylglucosaminyldiphosphoundecaprenol N-acetyl-beta-D-mannosaminyltransferase
MKEISVLGVGMTDRSLRESLRLVSELFSKDGLGTVSFIGTDLLIRAKDDAGLKDALENMDLLVPASVEILEAGGITSVTRHREVAGNYFLTELLKKLAKEKKKIFLIADTQDELVSLREQLLQSAKKLTFFGSFAFDGPDRSEDAVINAINSVIPDVIISVVSAVSQEKLMYSSRSMVNAGVWVSLLGQVRDSLGNKRRFFLSSVIDRFIFKRTLKRFGDDEKEDIGGI